MHRFIPWTLSAGVLLGSCGGPKTPAQEPVVTAAPPVEELEKPEPQEIAAPKIALVLGGGGARGFAHVGVVRVLEQEKIPIGLVVGTSVGSLIGAMYASNPDSFELEWQAFKLEKEDLFDFSLFSATTGPVKGEAIQDFVRKHVKESRIDDFKIPFIAVAADLNTGERVEFSSGGVVDAVRASVSIPGVFTPARVGNRVLVDGGVVANVAVDVARKHGADIIIAANITENVHNDNVSDVVSITLQAINIMMAEMTRHQIKQADVVITPEIGDVGTLDFTQKKRCMREGIEATRRAIKDIKGAIQSYYTQRNGIIPPQFMASASSQ